MKIKSKKWRRIVWFSVSILAFVLITYRPYISLYERYSSIEFQIHELEMEVFTSASLSLEEDGFLDISRFGNPFKVTVSARTESSKYRSIRIENLSLEPIGDRQGVQREWEDMQIQVFVRPVFSSVYRAAQSVFDVQLGELDYRVDLTIEVCESMGCESYVKTGELFYSRRLTIPSKSFEAIFLE